MTSTPAVATITSGATPAAPAAIHGRGPWQLAWARLRRDKVAIGSAVVITAIVLLALFAPLIAHVLGHSPDTQFRTTGLTPDGIPVGPGSTFYFGTDDLGRDVFLRVIYGARISLLVGVVASGLAVLVGVIVGLLAGYFAGTVDGVLSRLMDVVLSLPFLVFAIALVSLIGPSLLISVAVIAFFSWASVGRIIRGQVLSIREKEYIEASRLSGASDLRIMFVDILPNVLAPTIVYATMLIPLSIVFESTMSFLGIGVLPPTATWGNMLAESLPYYRVAWWFVAFPGLALLITTMAFNLLGDSVRDAFDPRGDQFRTTGR
ncbi:MAG: peptide/nickel transport system permease protein [Pseudonocardiales bacterium]|nr:peptide/nickel transport system permease protein [Pseudonocardiales bacterium]